MDGHYFVHFDEISAQWNLAESMQKSTERAPAATTTNGGNAQETLKNL